MNGHNSSSRLKRLVMVSAAVLLPFGVVACGDDTAGPETGTDVEDVNENDYFGPDGLVGQEVTVSAEVTDVFGGKAFELGGEDYGDDSLLVLSGKDVQDVKMGDVVQVTGTVRDFTYDEYAADYGLADPGPYTPYGDEEFLVAKDINMDVPQENG